LNDRKSPHFDDAAYLLGWLAYHRGNITDALNIFEVAIALLPTDDSGYGEHLDYAYAALHQTCRILRTLSPEDAINRVQNSKVLSSHSKAWYTVLGSFYHSHQYQLVMTGAQRALRKFGIRIEDLPVTTDPKRISTTFTKLKMADDTDLQEIVYLYHSSRELEQVEDILSDVSKESPLAITEKIKNVIIKYSLTSDSDLEGKPFRRGPKPLHKDLRQSLFVAQKRSILFRKPPIFRNCDNGFITSVSGSWPNLARLRSLLRMMNSNTSFPTPRS
jgi:hypothetical protein